ncbi:MAG: hypothetical protein QOI77_2747 [Blastocatellia bacterium]|jgi:hypothetical protein|nr:hypothetical protein [Blastocatellia bacterium]
MNRTKVSFLIAFALLLALATASAQKADKKWTEWSKKDAQKILDDSAWGLTQTDTDTSEMFFSPTGSPGAGPTKEQRDVNTDRSITGAVNQSVNVKFHVRFFSARPIRQALARMMVLQQNLAPDQTEKLKAFAELKSTSSIIVTVSFESTDQRYSGVAMQAFNSAITASMKNNTYLQRSDGKQLFLEEYVPPGKDGFGARFIFPREMDGQPYITDKFAEVRFYAKYPDGIKIDRRFKIAQMMYEGALEY